MRSYSPLTTAIITGEENEVKSLLEKKASVNATEYDGNTPLILAAASKHLNIIRMLLECKANTNHINKTDTVYGIEITALSAAISYNDTNVLKLLLEHKADINAGHTPALNQASISDRKEIVTMLLTEYNADINKTDSWGNTALMNAAASGSLTTVKTLLKFKNIDLDYKNLLKETARDRAAKRGHHEIVEILDEAIAFREKRNNSKTKIQTCLDAGAAFEEKKDLQSALNAYTRGIELREKDENLIKDKDLLELASCYCARGMVYARLNQNQLINPDYEASIHYFDIAINRFRDDNRIKVACYYDRGESHFILKHWELAIADFDCFIRQAPDEMLEKESAYYLRAKAMGFCRKPELVIAEYNKIIPKLTKTYKTESYLDRGKAYLALGQHVLAEQDFLNAIHNNKEVAAILIKGFDDTTIKLIIENNSDFYHKTFKHLLSEKQRALSVYKNDGPTAFAQSDNMFSMFKDKNKKSSDYKSPEEIKITPPVK